MKENELQHHGILGQKWGVRRFQNKDGTLTSAGKKRYNRENETPKKIGYHAKVGYRYEKTNVATMSNEEIMQRLERIQLEQSYNSIRRQDVSFGRAALSKINTTTSTVKDLLSSTSSILSSINSISNVLSKRDLNSNILRAFGAHKNEGE